MEKKDAAIDFVRRRKELLSILGVSAKTFQRMEMKGDAPARTQISDRVFGYRDSEIVKFLNSRARA